MKKSQFYRRAEKLLYSYLFTRYECENLRERVRLLSMDVKAQNYNIECRPASPPDPVAKLFDTRDKLIYQINMRLQEISQVEKFLDTLRANNLRFPDGVLIIEFIYFCKINAHDVANKLKISERTLYQRKKEIVKFFAEILQKS